MIGLSIFIALFILSKGCEAYAGPVFIRDATDSSTLVSTNVVDPAVPVSTTMVDSTVSTTMVDSTVSTTVANPPVSVFTMADPAVPVSASVASPSTPVSGTGADPANSVSTNAINPSVPTSTKQADASTVTQPNTARPGLNGLICDPPNKFIKKTSREALNDAFAQMVWNAAPWTEVVKAGEQYWVAHSVPVGIGTHEESAQITYANVVSAYPMLPYTDNF